MLLTSIFTLLGLQSEQMVKEVILPNLFAYSSLIFGLTNKGFMIEAKQVFDDMLKKGISPNHVVYDILIRGYAKEGNQPAIPCLMDEMRMRGLLSDDGCNQKYMLHDCR